VLHVINKIHPSEESWSNLLLEGNSHMATCRKAIHGFSAPWEHRAPHRNHGWYISFMLKCAMKLKLDQHLFPLKEKYLTVNILHTLILRCLVSRVLHQWQTHSPWIDILLKLQGTKSVATRFTSKPNFENVFVELIGSRGCCRGKQRLPKGINNILI